MTGTVTELTTGSVLVPESLFTRLVDRIVADEKLDRGLAVRIMDQTLAFLGACGRHHDMPLAPSELVDIGWHVFILYTHDYAAFCQRVAGRFLHHLPTDIDDPTAAGDAAHTTLTRTVAAIEQAGFVVDSELWPSTGTCTGCHNGCHDDPPPRAMNG
jgi:hypothetical protein